MDAPPDVEIHLLILTVKEPELLAVFELLEPLPRETKTLGYLSEHWMYYFGRFGLYNTVLLASHTAGIEHALHSLGDAIRQWQPHLVINVGIAWGADPTKQKLGDVLIAEKVVNIDDVRHEMSSILESGPMPEIDARSRAIVNTCKLLWHFNNVDDEKCQVHTGLYLGSNTLLNNPDRKKELLQRHPRAIGGEMESYAVYAAAARSKIQWMVIKGISDWGDGSKPPNKTYHGVATASAASFVHKICTTFPNLVERRDAESDEKKVDLDSKDGRYEGKKPTNLTSVVTHFKAKRLDELKIRIQLLQQQGPALAMCAITGVAGCGKSELAKAYAWQSRTDFKWRLDPDTSNNSASDVSYEQTYSALLYNFNIGPHKAYETETIEKMSDRLNTVLWQRINQYSSWIVIFDNAPSYTDIERYLPPKDLLPKGLVLVTTQSQRFVKGNRIANFDDVNLGIDPIQAAELLKEISGKDQEDDLITRTLTQEMDYSPLAIRISGYYIYEMQGTTFTGYLELLRSGREAELISIVGSHNLVNQATQDSRQAATLQATLKITVKAVEKLNPRLYQTLQYCGYLANENIPLYLLSQLCRRDDEDIQYTKQWLSTALVGHGNYSVLTHQSHNDTCFLHRTTQSVLRSITANPAKMIQKIAAVTLHLYWYDPYCTERLRLCKTLEPHLIALLDGINSNPTASTTLITESLKLKLFIGKIRYEFGNFRNALEYFQEASELLDAIPPSEKLEIAFDIHRHLGNTKLRIWDLNKASISFGYEIFTRDLRSAEKDLNKAVNIAEQIYKITDWRLGQIYNDKASILEQSLDSIRNTGHADFLKDIAEFVRVSGHDSVVIINKAYKQFERVLESQNAIRQTVHQFSKDLGPEFPDPVKALFYKYCKSIEDFRVKFHETQQLFERSQQICSGVVTLPFWKKLYRFVIKQQQETSATTSCKSWKLELARSYHGRAFCFLRLRNLPEATDYFNRARQIYEQVLPNSYMTKIWQDPEISKIFTDGVCPFEIALRQTMVCGKGPGLTTINATHPTRMKFSTPDKVLMFL